MPVSPACTAITAIRCNIMHPEQQAELSAVQCTSCQCFSTQVAQSWWQDACVLQLSQRYQDARVKVLS